ncbi:MAG: hypothetical protein B1H02_01720 [Candidatus Latescibacteria bacterium 4484_107]|nr:MAG: hypothetical protein B1H02_01720 [Candidatus Latescibacteria bacterium 4484_107]
MTQINLLPRKKHFWEGMPPIWAVLFVGVALAALVGALVLVGSGSKKEPSVKSPSAAEEVVPSERAAVGGKEAPITEIARRRVRMDLLDRIRETIPPFVWLTTITATAADEVFVQGMAFSQARIREFAQRLDGAKISMIEKSTFEGRDVSKFSLTGRLSHQPCPEQPPAFLSPDARERTIASVLRKGKLLHLNLVRGPEQATLDPPAFRERFILRGEGTYDQLKAFMHDLSERPEAVSVSRIAISAQEAMRAETSMVTATFSLDFYIRPEPGKTRRRGPG